MQEEHLKNNRLNIPLLFMADIINGYKTIFPIPLAQGCTFDPDLVRQLAETAAREGAAAGVHVTFSPMADLVRDPRWGRGMESTGEDPYLNGIMAEQMVKGYQAVSYTHLDVYKRQARRRLRSPELRKTAVRRVLRAAESPWYVP